ncbi:MULTISPECIES: hypothetical protein [unclassified Pseudomonas]|jgi:hypothetical protein|uniref:hypothetical protein n=1 Tax=unclassified Pseudomonas TaxID=196821 RepID=UPI000BA31B15|nr:MULTISPECIES: hypothetical protein [unclassified Pseudomonas]MCU1720431.1 hypothetical protein [Pseudomonas sp. 5P_5.1_Bac1]MCU1735005.1 hypothetical protein [Pseudomonas sp. 20P_3.2_Bac4]MCU1743480.1 hypothetical protein [Pseudomonas sp. 20P_3.2_Bac5]
MNDTAQRPELNAWHAMLTDDGYRLDSPDAWHASLLRGADELLASGVVDRDECQALKALAEGGHARALEDAVDSRVADPDA